MNKKILTTIILGIFLFSLASAESIGTFKVNEPMQITNYFQDGTCSYMNLVNLELPNNTIININTAMTNNNQAFNFSYTPTELGIYTFKTCGNPGGNIICNSDTFESTSTGTRGSMFFLILLTSIAMIFFIASLFVPEEFFVYISGVSFLIGGIYLMTNGIDVLNDTNTRYLAFIYLGVGLLFTLGAYIYNLYSNDSEEEY